MAKKSRRPATPPPAARFSPAARLVSGLTALMMVGSLIFVVVAGGRGGEVRYRGVWRDRVRDHLYGHAVFPHAEDRGEGCG